MLAGDTTEADLLRLIAGLLRVAADRLKLSLTASVSPAGTHRADLLPSARHRLPWPGEADVSHLTDCHDAEN